MKKIQKWNKPAVRVFDANEHPNPEDPGGTKDCFKEIDALIARGEALEQQEKAYKAQELEKEFRKRLYTELKKKSLKEMSWNEVELWSDLHQHREEHFYTPDVAKRYAAIHKNDEDNIEDGTYRQALYYIEQSKNVIKDIVAVAPNNQAWVEDWEKIGKLLEKLVQAIMEQEEKVPSYNDDDVRDQTPVEVTKSMGIQKSGDRKISGFASAEIVDSSNERITQDALRKVMKTYMKRGAPLLLNHQAKPVGRITNYDFRYHPTGAPAVWIEAELFDDYASDNDIWKNIQNGTYNSFSIGGIASQGKKQYCEDKHCWTEIPAVDLFEISLCERGMNPLAKLDVN